MTSVQHVWARMCKSDVTTTLLMKFIPLLLVLLYCSPSHCEIQRDSHPKPEHTGRGSGRTSCRETVAVLKEQLKVLRQMRIEYGKMHCKEKGIGPTGGFCINSTGGVGMDYYDFMWDKALCKTLAKMLAGKSILDVGCGAGHYGRCMTEADPTIQWHGVDGAEGIVDATGGYVHFMDLSVPQYLKKYDVAMSLEVGEHIPREFEGIFLGNVVRHAKQSVLLSWAVPGQGGHQHVNEQKNDYIISRMKDAGFRYDPKQSDTLRAASSLKWFKNTLMMFHRKTAE